jgi:hypothetical protein
VRADGAGVAVEYVAACWGEAKVHSGFEFETAAGGRARFERLLVTGESYISCPAGSSGLSREDEGQLHR